MAFFLQRRAIQQHVKQELSRITDSPDEFSTYIPRTPEEQEVQESGHVETKGEPFTQIPGITLMQDCNGRRYYQVDWAGPNDPLNPKKWSTIHRVGATMLVCLVAFVATIASSIESAVLTSATAEFGVSEVAESLATALFLVGMGLGALLLSPLSELLGRYLVYLVSLFIFGCWILGAALAPNFGAQLVFRFLAGFSASAPLTVAGGTVGDMWDPIEKTFALPLYAIPAFGGPVFGPVIGAYVGYDPSVDWRWAEWITLILVSATFTLILLLKKESFAPRILHYKAACFRKLTGNERFMTAAEASHASLGELMSKSFLRPFLLSTQPIVVAFTLYLTIVYIILFTFLDGYPFIFAETYGINEGLSNICFMGLFIGIMLSAILVPLAYRQTLYQLKQDGDDGSGKLVHRESRLFFAMVGAPALPIGLFWMGWTDYNSISIWSPLAASVLVGFSNICIFMSAYMYIIDSYEAYAASALTFNALTRYIAAGGMTVVGIPMYRNLGTHWTLTLLGCLGVLTVPIPYVLYRYGPSLRRRSQWAV